MLILKELILVWTEYCIPVIIVSESSLCWHRSITAALQRRKMFIISCVQYLTVLMNMKSKFASMTSLIRTENKNGMCLRGFAMKVRQLSIHMSRFKHYLIRLFLDWDLRTRHTAGKRLMRTVRSVIKNIIRTWITSIILLLSLFNTWFYCTHILFPPNIVTVELHLILISSIVRN